MENLATVIIEGKRLILKPIALNYIEVVFQEFTIVKVLASFSFLFISARGTSEPLFGN